MPEKSNHTLGRLRKRVERALAGGARSPEVMRDLEAIVREGDGSSHDALFAHRQLAELRLQDSPWSAALHLRQIIQAQAADDSVFALMGLCQAMLGNFKSAILAYKRAIELAPRNPWYHHNLGHLLDVGLGNASSALRHLHLAHQIEPTEDEIAASLSQCNARLGKLDEAKELALLAVRCAPRNMEHRALLDWLLRGAPGQRMRSRDFNGLAPRQHGIARVRRDEARDPVSHLLAKHMPDAGFSSKQVARAQALWGDFCDDRDLRVTKASVYAAAVEYALAKVCDKPGVTQTLLGQRYGVSPAAISGRYAEIRSALALAERDPRYAS